jgi:hypothetical protein
LTAVELLPVIALLDRLAEQMQRSGVAIPGELKVSWYELERRLLVGLRAEERAVAHDDTAPFAELKAIAANERIRNLVWEVSLALELQSPRLSAMRQLATLLRARAEAPAHWRSVEDPAA